MKKKLSLIVAVYKNIEFLHLVLSSIERQIYRNFEVIIAEDDENCSVNTFLEKQKKRLSFPLHHISQKDRGFRKNKILNRAICKATGSYLVFIDGDCILHPKFLLEYARRVKPETALFGRRIQLDPETTQRLINDGNIEALSFFRLLWTKSRHVEDGIYLPFIRISSQRNILGSNFCVSRKIMERINGFDEDFTSPLYGEDTDVGRRLRLAGIRLESTRFKTIQYHLHHPTPNRRKAWEISGALYQQKMSENRYFCPNGLKKER